MPTATYTPLATVTLGSSAASVTFSSIPATYRDLILVVEAVTASGSGAMGVGARYNGDTGSNYSDVFMAGDGSTAFSGAPTGTSNPIGRIDQSRGNFISQLMDYSATDKHKTSLTRINNSIAVVTARAGRWANTSAVTSINLFNSSANGEVFAIGSTFNLYGVIA